MTTKPGERSYFLNDFSDEVVPCDPTLEGWAAWLAKPHLDWPLPGYGDGATFDGMAMVFEEDVVMTRRGGEWHFSREPEAGRFLAVRFAPGMGWTADDIVLGGESGDGCDALRAWAAELDITEEGWTEHVACAVIEQGWRFTYHDGPPPRLEAERVQ